MVLVTIVVIIDIKNMSVYLSLSKHIRGVHLMVTSILDTSLDISHKIIDPRWTPTRNQEIRVILSIGITKHGIHVLHVESMVIFLQNTWDYILEEDLTTGEILASHAIIFIRSII